MNHQHHFDRTSIRQLPHEESDEQVACSPPPERPSGDETASRSGRLIINADDWGRCHDTTARILTCVTRRTVSSVSAMVFMEDSERAAEIAREQDIDAGLHLNFTTAFSAANCSAPLTHHQQRIARCIRRFRLAPAVFHPTLMASFEYVVLAQIEEFSRLYGRMPQRLDGHHHMHLCANVLIRKLLPSQTIVRRNFSFEAGEKSFANRFYRRMVDRTLARRHRLTDFFFSLAPLTPGIRLQKIFALARHFRVEVETHPATPDEYQFLFSRDICRLTDDVCITRGYVLS